MKNNYDAPFMVKLALIVIAALVYIGLYYGLPGAGS